MAKVQRTPRRRVQARLEVVHRSRRYCRLSFPMWTSSPLPFSFVLLMLSLPLTSSWSAESRTVHAEFVGNPLLSRYPRGEAVYARNVWDLQIFDGRLYIGAGNSNNRGPAPNAGPVPIIAYDPQRNVFQREYLVDDEQIDQYYVFDGELYLPGHDPRESWELGNLYRLAVGGKWQKLRTIPHAIHTYALALHKGALYAGLGSSTEQGKPISSVAVSTDGGHHWHWSPLSGRRIHAFLQVAGMLYATDVYPRQPRKRTATYEIHGLQTIVPRDDLDRTALFPSTPLQQRATRLAKPVTLGNSTVYIGAYYILIINFCPLACISPIPCSPMPSMSSAVRCRLSSAHGIS